jgi:hypothetical protein
LDWLSPLAWVLELAAGQMARQMAVLMAVLMADSMAQRTMASEVQQGYL